MQQSIQENYQEFYKTVFLLFSLVQKLSGWQCPCDDRAQANYEQSYPRSGKFSDQQPTLYF